MNRKLEGLERTMWVFGEETKLFKAQYAKAWEIANTDGVESLEGEL